MNKYAAPNDSTFLNKRYSMNENEKIVNLPEYENKEISPLIRNEFQRDRDRIIHSRAFRRLMHKTQIFNANLGDHYRNRLTHSLEVNQIARSIGKALNLNDELIEAIALGHDLGHTPFGHVGERTLHMILSNKIDIGNDMVLKNKSGFKHNFQGLQVVDNIETTSNDYEGMNLTLAVREGILKHTSRMITLYTQDEYGKVNRIKEEIIYECLDLTDINVSLPSFTLEGQVVAIADEIAQCTHDLEDGIRYNTIKINDLFSLNLIKKVMKVYNINQDTIKDTINIRNVLIKSMVGFLINDVYFASISNLEKYINEESKVPSFTNKDDIYKKDIITFSNIETDNCFPSISKMVKELSDFITKTVVMSQNISKSDAKSEYIIKQLFNAYYKHPQQLPDYILIRYYKRIGKELDRLNLEKDIPMLRKDIRFIRLICDHIAGMSDQYAAREHKKLYEPEFY